MRLYHQYRTVFLVSSSRPQWRGLLTSFKDFSIPLRSSRNDVYSIEVCQWQFIKRSFLKYYKAFRYFVKLSTGKAQRDSWIALQMIRPYDDHISETG